VKIYHPNQPVLQSFTPQISNNPFKLNDYHTKPTFFQHAPTPPPPPHYILQAQNPNQILPHKECRTVPTPITVSSCKQSTNSKPKPISRSREYTNPISPFHQWPTQSTNLCQPFCEFPNGAKSKPKQKLRSSSRRITQRRTKRQAKKFAEASILSPATHPTVNNHLKTTEAKCLAAYGFYASPELSLQNNFNNALKKIETLWQYQQPKNLAFHNLCKNNVLPPGSRALLGLNLKFCLAHKTITNDINKTVLRLARSIRINYYLNENGIMDDSAYEKQIYVKNSNWHPLQAPWLVEEKITDFEKALKQKHQDLINKNQKIIITNLTPLQAKAMRLLKNNQNIIIKPTDKNLGPAVMDTSQYIHQILKEHLLTGDYKQLSQPEAKHRMEQLKKELNDLITAHT